MARYKNGIKMLGPSQYEVLATRKDPTRPGKRLRRRRKVEGGRAEARDALRQLEDSLAREARGHDSATMTLSDYAPQWLGVRVLARSTQAKYINDLERHILPYLCDVPLRELRPRHIREFLAGDLGAPNSKKNRLALLRAMAKDAIADELVELDFCLRVTVKVPPVYSEANPNLLDRQQRQALFDHIPKYWKDLAAVIALTGERFGEASALRWQYIDLVGATADISWSNWRGTLKAPKTDRSRRVVPLPAPLPTMLAARLEHMLAEKHPGLERDLVFPTLTGGLYKGSPLRSILDKACVVAGVTRITPHGLRRTFNDMARRNASGEVVRALLGHASEAMTDHYSIVDAAEKAAAAQAVADGLDLKLEQE